MIGSFWQFLTIKYNTLQGTVIRSLACCITLFPPIIRRKIPYNCKCFSSATWNLSHQLYIDTFRLLSTFFSRFLLIHILFVFHVTVSSVQQPAYFTVNNFPTLQDMVLTFPMPLFYMSVFTDACCICQLLMKMEAKTWHNIDFSKWFAWNVSNLIHGWFMFFLFTCQQMMTNHFSSFLLS